ncbi:MAG: hypothetical protein LW717_04725 [Chloroflexaceae bacterium]|nr:hypothetical protein [Chloroflexaceae bacterium]
MPITGVMQGLGATGADACDIDTGLEVADPHAAVNHPHSFAGERSHCDRS